MLHSANAKTVCRNVYTVIPWICAFVHFFLISLYSSQPAGDSAEKSRVIAENIAKTLQNVVAISEGEEGPFSMFFVHALVRKCAHLLNFFILGFMYSIVFANYDGVNLHSMCAASGICGLLASVMDESHQYFVSGRSAQLSDVALDFFGVLIGVFVFAVLFFIYTDNKNIKGERSLLL